MAGNSLVVLTAAAYRPIGFAVAGTRVVLAESAGDHTQTLTLWDAAGGSPLGSLADSSAPPQLDATGTKLTTILADHTIEIWDLTGGSRSSIVGEQLQRAALDPTGNFIAGVDKDGVAVIVLNVVGGRRLARWSIANDSPTITQEGFDAPRATVSWSRDGKSIVCVSTRLAVWSAGVALPENLAQLVGRNVPWKVDNGRLVPALAQRHGRVLRGEVPVANAKIVLVYRKPPDLGSEPTTWQSTTVELQQIELDHTDPAGRFGRAGLAPGEYTIEVQAPGAAMHAEDVRVSVEDEAVDIDVARSTH